MNAYRLQHTAREWIAARAYSLLHPSALSDERLQEIVSQPKRVLIVIAGLLGDTIMSIPVLPAARACWPAARLTVLGVRHNRELLCDAPEIDDWIETAAFPFSMRHRAAVRQLGQQVASGRFDVALLVLGDQFALMLAEAGVPVRVGVRGHALAPCLTHEYDIGSARTWGPDERLNALRVLGFDVPTAVPRLRPSAATLKSGVDALSRIRAGALSANARNLDRQRYAVIHPFGSTRRQWWPVDRVNELARHVAQVDGLPTVLIGGPDTREVDVPLPSDSLDARGRLSVRELVGVLAGADLVLSTDSGPFHIAGALGRPLIGLFRARRPEHATRYPQAHVRFGEFESCQRECEWDRCVAESCRQMAALSVDAVASAVDEACAAAAR